MKNRLPVFLTQNVVFTVSLNGNRILLLGYLPVTCEVPWKKGYQNRLGYQKTRLHIELAKIILAITKVQIAMMRIINWKRLKMSYQ